MDGVLPRDPCADECAMVDCQLRSPSGRCLVHAGQNVLVVVTMVGVDQDRDNLRGEYCLTAIFGDYSPQRQPASAQAGPRSPMTSRDDARPQPFDPGECVLVTT